MVSQYRTVSYGKWMVLAYDAYGRTTETGLVTSASEPDPFNLTPTEIWTKTFWDGQAATGVPDKTNEAIYSQKISIFLT